MADLVRTSRRRSAGRPPARCRNAATAADGPAAADRDNRPASVATNLRRSARPTVRGKGVHRQAGRSEERRVGEERVSTCKSRCAPCNKINNKYIHEKQTKNK